MIDYDFAPYPLRKSTTALPTAAWYFTIAS